VRPTTVEGDWNRLYSEFADVYDEWASVAHVPNPVDVIAQRWPLAGATVVDVGSGTGTSTFELAAHDADVLGVEPNAAMRALAEARAASADARATFAAGSATALPLGDGLADIVTCITTVFSPPEEVVPAFVAEAERVLRPAGTIVVLTTPPGWYGGDLRDVAAGGSDYEERLDDLLASAGFDSFDFATTQAFGTVERAVETYGFVFGAAAIEHLRQRRQTTVSWRWRVRHRTR